jgi:hypothetical protein
VGDELEKAKNHDQDIGKVGPMSPRLDQDNSTCQDQANPNDQKAKIPERRPIPVPSRLQHTEQANPNRQTDYAGKNDNDNPTDD